jgi:hypothetical protein
MMPKEGTEEVRKGYETKAQVEDVPKVELQKKNR